MELQWLKLHLYVSLLLEVAHAGLMFTVYSTHAGAGTEFVQGSVNVLVMFVFQVSSLCLTLRTKFLCTLCHTFSSTLLFHSIASAS